MRKRFVGLLAFALILTCAAGAMAWQTPINHPDWTAGSNASDVIFGQRIDNFGSQSRSTASDNITIVLFNRSTATQPMLMLSGDSGDNFVSGDSRFVRLSPDTNTSSTSASVDFVLFRVGEQAKNKVFRTAYWWASRDVKAAIYYNNAIFAGHRSAAMPQISYDVVVRGIGTNWNVRSYDHAGNAALTTDPIQFWSMNYIASDDASSGRRLESTGLFGVSGDFGVEWSCPACGTMPCYLLSDLGLLYFDLSADRKPVGTLAASDLNISGADSLDMAVYRPCEAYQKQWQVMPNNRFPKYQDLVLYSTNISGTHGLYLGAYVIDGEYWRNAAAANVEGTYTWLFAGMNTSTIRYDWVAERIWNKGPLFGNALVGDTDSDGSRFEWEVLGEISWYTRTTLANNGLAFDNYKVLSIYQSNDVAAPANTDWGVGNRWVLPFAYLAKQDATVGTNGRTLVRPNGVADTNRWYRFLMPYNQSADMNPGFSVFFGKAAGGPGVANEGTSADFRYAGSLTSGGVRMDFDASAATQDFCQRTYLTAKIWSDVAFCFQVPIASAWAGWDNATCVNLTPKSVDQDMWRELHTKMSTDNVITGTFPSPLAPYYVHADFPDVCECGTVETLFVDATNTWQPTGASICVKASLDVYNKGACVTNKTYFLPAKVTFFVSQNQICDATTKANIDAAVTAITGEQLNKGPIDAFMMSGDTTVGEGKITFGYLAADSQSGTTGTWYNLGYLGLEKLSADRTTYPWWGVKNFFRVWPTKANEDGTPQSGGGFAGGVVAENREKVVRQSWLDGDKLAFSFYVVLVPAAAPAGVEPVQTMDGYFLIYTGSWPKVDAPSEIDATRIMAQFGMFSNWKDRSATSVPAPTITVAPTVAPTSGPTPTSAPTTPTVAPTSGPTTTPTPGSGGSSGGGCNVGFAPAVLLLLAPMALFLRK